MVDAQMPVDEYMNSSFPSSVLSQQNSAGKLNEVRGIEHSLQISFCTHTRTTNPWEQTSAMETPKSMQLAKRHF